MASSPRQRAAQAYLRRGQLPAASAKDRIAWRICAFAAGAEQGCACKKRGNGHCEAVGKVTESVFLWARDDIESGNESGV